ncbi:hypothetical protein SO802_009345 [Lithocarpus litseifolius]|uniref:Uncharacterized protein n=1 Tax=Lithocarpus litseifolius TaxID=425828 RepID=A0AAW2DDP8_9ROSI
MCVTWISACCRHLCSSIISVDGFMAVDIGSLDEHCKSFKWLDGIPCRRGAKTAPIVIAKFTRLEAEATMARNNKMEARAMIVDLLHRERVAKCSAEKARVSFSMGNARERKYQIALLMSWLAFVVLFIFSLGNREVGLRLMCLP